MFQIYDLCFEILIDLLNRLFPLVDLGKNLGVGLLIHTLVFIVSLCKPGP